MPEAVQQFGAHHGLQPGGRVVVRAGAAEGARNGAAVEREAGFVTAHGAIAAIVQPGTPVTPGVPGMPDTSAANARSSGANSASCDRNGAWPQRANS